MVGDNNSDGAPVSPEGRYRVVFGRGDVHRYACEATRVQLCSAGIVVPVGIVAVLMVGGVGVVGVGGLVPPYVGPNAKRLLARHMSWGRFTLAFGVDDMCLVGVSTHPFGR